MYTRINIKDFQNRTFKIVHLALKRLSNRSRIRDPQMNQKRDPQNRSPHPEMTFKPIQFSKGPKTVIFKFLPRGIRVTPVHFPLGDFQKSANKQTNDNRSQTNIISEVAYTIAPFGMRRKISIAIIAVISEIFT